MVSIRYIRDLPEKIGFIKKTTRLEAGSNTSTVILRVVEDDKKEVSKFETVKYGHESQETRTLERLRWRGPAAYTSEREPHRKMPVTVKE
jgi:hypothetical protein